MADDRRHGHLEVIKHVSRSQDEFDTFVPRIRYEYVANRVRCEGEIIRIGLDEAGYLSEKQAREHMARYCVGATVAVRYDRNTRFWRQDTLVSPAGSSLDSFSSG